MKLNSDFLIHNTGNGEMLIPVGEETKKFHGVIKLNETGSLIVHLLENDNLSMEELLDRLYAQYDGDKAVINQTVKEFINKLKEVNAITD